ncbi:hypothetical protein [uncultured Shimia sp.]|uniref:hypothetical protein n=1 Tax=uncultured Shimia sp. TaxID=573152 RepID=UPI0025E612C0|nr:hypothetical protein [uncultured Shimia sp.]
MASAASIAQNTGRELAVIWRQDEHCQCRLRDLIDYDGVLIEDDNADLMRRYAAVEYNYMEIEPNSCFAAPILEDPEPYVGQDIYVRSAYSLQGPHVDFNDEQSFLRNLEVASPVQDLIAQVRHPNQLAAHIRAMSAADFEHLPYEAAANWPKERHAELMEWRRKSQPARFMDRIDQIFEQGDAQTFFVAADHPDTYASLHTRYGDRMVCLKRDLFDRSPQQLQYALADLILLTAADRFLASTYSSFSDIAQRLAPWGRPIEKSGIDF